MNTLAPVLRYGLSSLCNYVSPFCVQNQYLENDLHLLHKEEGTDRYSRCYKQGVINKWGFMQHGTSSRRSKINAKFSGYNNATFLQICVFLYRFDTYNSCEHFRLSASNLLNEFVTSFLTNFVYNLSSLRCQSENWKQQHLLHFRTDVNETIILKWTLKYMLRGCDQLKTGFTNGIF